MPRAKRKVGRPESEMERLGLNLRLPPGTTARLKAAAARDNRPLASWVVLLLQRALEQEET
jgi:predicted HicB family RNase H-like nuclease